MPQVLLVDDDPRFVKVVASLLSRRNLQVKSVSNGGLARQALNRMDVDLALLDLNLPDIDGLSLLHQLREEGNNTPVIVLTARSKPHEQVLGLRLGGDDYITKPFDPELLLARIHAVLRRSSAGAGRTIGRGRSDLVDLPPVLIDLSARQVFKDGVAVRLAPMEYAVLEFLALNRGRAVSKEEIMLQVWGTDRGVSRTLTEHISRLRRKLGEGLVITMTGFGYIIPTDPQVPAAKAQ
ncbi:response regulator transcription factor [Actinoallomurus purpureus]|uniref:response regulator transcription factor n=1 Tax=Actinoallomurus purpureus TaxID=478114 RepID=UPI002092F34E|nr:response regulator transcription factor [Actinoallomurus purpureus]MCO6009177.1 response regulator transcription factor [Actinoallomurus purpureus]